MATTRRGRGVTLLELLIALALLGLLAGLAYPSYRGHMVRAYRMEAIEALMALAAAQERFHLEHGSYAEGFAPDHAPGLALPTVTAGGRYRLLLDPAAPGTHSARAVARDGPGAPQDARCHVFGLDASGRRWATDREGRETTGQCWR